MEKSERIERNENMKRGGVEKVRNWNTGFPEPFCVDRNTTLPHPSADTSANATIEGSELDMKPHAKSRFFHHERGASWRSNHTNEILHGKHEGKSHGNGSGNLIFPGEEGKLYEGISYKDDKEEEENGEEEHGEGEGERLKKKGFLGKMLAKV